MADLSLLLEAEKRGLLPPEKALLLQEARSRGLVPGGESPQQQTPETTWGGVAGEVGKGLLRGAGDVGRSMGRVGANMLGPVGGMLANQGIEALSAPSQNLVAPTPATPTERFAGTGSEILGASAVTGGAGTIPKLIGTGVSALGGAAGEQMGGEAGQAAGTMLPAVAAPAQAAGRWARNWAYPTPGNLGARAAGDRTQAVIDALRTTESKVPGMNLTPGQASVPANSPEFAAFQKLLESTNQSKYGHLGIRGQQREARLGAVQEFGGTPDELTAAVKARGAAVDPIYQEARRVGIDPEMAQILQPQIKNLIERMPKGVVEKAKELARLEGENFTEMGSVSGMHYVKKSVDELLASVGPTGTGPATKRALSIFKKDLMTVLEELSPKYAEGSNVYRSMSPNINQMKVGQDLERALVAPATGTERGASFGNAVRKAETTISKGSGRERIKDLTPEQRATIKAIEENFKLNADYKQIAGEGAKEMEKRIAPPQLYPSGFFQPLVSAARGWVNKAVGTGHDIGLRKAAQIAHDPKVMARLLEEELKKTSGPMFSEGAARRAALAAILYEQGQQP